MNVESCIYPFHYLFSHNHFLIDSHTFIVKYFANKGGGTLLIEILKKNWFLIVLVIFVIIFILMMNNRDFVDVDQDNAITALSTDDDLELVEDNSTSGSIVVDIKGEVVNPGVYEIESDIRVNDVVRLAGGFTKEANEVHVNLAQIVQDEMVIVVPKIGEEGSYEEDNVTGSNKIRVNYATQEEVETLPGIGSSKAQAIIKYREEHGMFKNIDDLLNISGIGEKTLENMRDDIELH